MLSSFSPPDPPVVALLCHQLLQTLPVITCCCQCAAAGVSAAGPIIIEYTPESLACLHTARKIASYTFSDTCNCHLSKLTHEGGTGFVASPTEHLSGACSSSGGGRLLKRLAQVAQQVVHSLNADREADQAVADAEGGAHFCRD